MGVRAEYAHLVQAGDRFERQRSSRVHTATADARIGAFADTTIVETEEGPMTFRLGELVYLVND